MEITNDDNDDDDNNNSMTLEAIMTNNKWRYKLNQWRHNWDLFANHNEKNVLKLLTNSHDTFTTVILDVNALIPSQKCNAPFTDTYLHKSKTCILSYQVINCNIHKTCTHNHTQYIYIYIYH